MNPTDSSRKKQLITLLAVLLAIVIIVGATVVASRNKSDDNASETTTSNTSSQTSNADVGTSSGDTNASTDTPETTSKYKDGTYSADATYQSPGGPEDISVKLTVAGGVVKDSSVTTDPSDKEAEEYQNMFISGYESQVIGKPIDEINLSRVSGSSLTSKGFNDAVDKIKQQAKG